MEPMWPFFTLGCIWRNSKAVKIAPGPIFWRPRPAWALVTPRLANSRRPCHLATDPEALRKINAAILGSFGGKDQGIPPESVKKFEATLQQHGKRVEIKIYPDAGHGFENPNNKAGSRPDDAADAWKRTIAFLADTLKK